MHVTLDDDLATSQVIRKRFQRFRRSIFFDSSDLYHCPRLSQQRQSAVKRSTRFAVSIPGDQGPPHMAATDGARNDENGSAAIGRHLFGQ
jgi:hypothetical protein